MSQLPSTFLTMDVLLFRDKRRLGRIIFKGNGLDEALYLNLLQFTIILHKYEVIVTFDHPHKMLLDRRKLDL